MCFRRRNDAVYKGLIAGALGGLTASWVMTRFQVILAQSSGHIDPHEGQGEDATVLTAERISRGVLDHKLTAEEKKTAGPFVHYAYGTGIGALYGGLAQKKKIAALGFGSAYGATAWALGDEIAVPALGLGKRPTETPAWQHVQTLAAHLVYGITLEAVRRVVLKAL